MIMNHVTDRQRSQMNKVIPDDVCFRKRYYTGRAENTLSESLNGFWHLTQNNRQLLIQCVC